MRSRWERGRRTHTGGFCATAAPGRLVLAAMGVAASQGGSQRCCPCAAAGPRAVQISMAATRTVLSLHFQQENRVPRGIWDML